METLGGFDTIAITQVKQLASALARSKGSDEREAASQVFGRLSLNLMRGNALMLASRAPDVDIPRTEVDGVEWIPPVFWFVIPYRNKDFLSQNSSPRPSLHLWSIETLSQLFDCLSIGIKFICPVNTLSQHKELHFSSAHFCIHGRVNPATPHLVKLIRLKNI